MTRKSKKRQEVLVPARHPDVADVLERVLTKGVILESEEDAGDTPADSEWTLVWIRVAIADLDVVRIDAGLSWRYLFEADEDHDDGSGA